MGVGGIRTRGGRIVNGGMSLRGSAGSVPAKRLLHNLSVGPRSSEAVTGKAEEGGDSEESSTDENAARRRRSRPKPGQVEKQSLSSAWPERAGTEDEHPEASADYADRGGTQMAQISELKTKRSL